MSRRKEPVTAVDAEVEAIQSVRVVLKPTRKLEPRAQQIFAMVIAMRPISMWGAFDMQLATDLAELSYRVECVESVLAIEGDVLTTRLGAPIVNPRATHCGSLKRQAITLTRALGLSAGQRALGTAPNRERAVREMDLQQAARDADDDPLLA
ncbi:hypothetical protein HNO86_08440 [Pseudomonas sp. C1C7]|uniref:hypothetical protein n=1 Tax=Pseudomonas sp. C1C7 TaxID=2735272 RepID=UPI001586A094|nr:hypothetical protein [Pseudomonas sp. C1C7]NUT75065.1 hypothetical protein [Pseudomonas sp. C1C7]